jgi:hypothetical protein
MKLNTCKEYHSNQVLQKSYVYDDSFENLRSLYQTKFRFERYRKWRDHKRNDDEVNKVILSLCKKTMKKY